MGEDVGGWMLGIQTTLYCVARTDPGKLQRGNLYRSCHKNKGTFIMGKRRTEINGGGGVWRFAATTPPSTEQLFTKQEQWFLDLLKQETTV